MYKALVSDLSRTLLSAADENYTGKLNGLHEKLIEEQGDYDFWSYFRLHQDLLAFYKTLSEKIDVYIFTTKFIQEYPPLAEKLEPIFKDIFSARRLGLQKKLEPEAYKVVAEKIDLEPKEILYIDDKQANLDAAMEAGMTVIKFESEEQAIKDIGKAMENFLS